MYAKDISKKVRSALIVKKHNGEFVGKLAPYGYIKDPKDKHHFLVDEEAAKVDESKMTVSQRMALKKQQEEVHGG